MGSQRFKTKLAAALTISMMLSGCGKSSFESGSPSSSQRPDNGQNAMGTPGGAGDPGASQHSGPSGGTGAGSPSQNVNNEQIPSAPGAQQFELSCTALKSPATSSVQVTTNGQPTPVQFTGHLCPLTTGRLNVLFLVDWSGSMKANDPVVSGSCGRLQAAQAITNYIKANAGTGIAVAAGMIPFNDNVVASNTLPLTSIANFSAGLTVSNYCSASGTTNYIAALRAAKAQLANATGRTIVYFISDGLPNIDDTGTKQPDNNPTVNDQSAAAGLALRAAFPNLTLNALLLGSDGAAAQAVMTRITGSSKQVKVVAQATDLANAILNFPPPTLSTANASLNAPGANPVPVQIKSVSLAPNSTSDWIFTTAPFTVPGSGISTLQVSAAASDGTSEQASIQFSSK